MKLKTSLALTSILAVGLSSGAFALDDTLMNLESWTDTSKTVITLTKDDSTAGVANEAYFYATNSANNSTLVQANGTKISTDYGKAAPKQFASIEDYHYLKVSIDQPLYRTIMPITDIAVPWTFTTVPVADTGTYIDTLVQFTPSDLAPTTDRSKDKLVVWMDANSNIVISAGFLDGADGSVYDVTNFPTIQGAPGTWYRLTIKAIKDITTTAQIPGFQVYLDGVLLASPATYHSIGSTLAGAFDSAVEGGTTVWTADQKALINANKVFASVAGVIGVATPNIQAVGFQGEGLVADLVFTETDPFAAVTSLDFTLALGENVSSVKYVIDNVTNDFVAATPTLKISAANTVVTVIPTYADWYTAGTNTVNDTAKATVADNTFTVLTAGGTGTVVAASVANTSAGGVTNSIIDSVSDDDAAKALAWAKATGKSPAELNAYDQTLLEQSYLLSQTELLTAAPVLTITSITEDATTWKITVKAAKADGTAITLKDIYGYLEIKYATDLSGTWTNQPYTEGAVTVDAATGIATLTLTKTGSFMKATINATKTTL